MMSPVKATPPPLIFGFFLILDLATCPRIMGVKGTHSNALTNEEIANLDAFCVIWLGAPLSFQFIGFKTSLILPVFI